MDQDTDLGNECYYHHNKNLRKAIRVYRDYQQILRNNSLPEKRRKFRIYEKNAQTDLSDSLWRRLAGRFSNLIWLHGESWKRIVITSVVVVSLYSVLYVFAGIEQTNTLNLPQSYDISRYQIPMPEILNIILLGIYFSILTFSTMGYGDVQPSSMASRFLAGSEALIGGLLIAALVFVLGRRATW